MRYAETISGIIENSEGSLIDYDDYEDMLTDFRLVLMNIKSSTRVSMGHIDSHYKIFFEKRQIDALFKKYATSDSPSDST